MRYITVRLYDRGQAIFTDMVRIPEDEVCTEVSLPVKVGFRSLRFVVEFDPPIEATP